LIEAFWLGADKATEDPDAPHEYFSHWYPEAKNSIAHDRFKPASLPANLQATHHLSFTIVDKRRKGLFQTGSKSILSGLVVKSHDLPLFRSSASKTCHPELDACKEVKDDPIVPDDAADAADAIEETFTGQMKDYKGWRCSYLSHGKWRGHEP